MKKNVRLGTFDLTKGLGMVIIIIVHNLGIYGQLMQTASKSIVLTMLKFGLMPFFFLVSGYNLHPRKDKKKYLIKSFNELIKPYLVVTLIHVILFPIIRYPVIGSRRALLLENLKMTLSFVLGTAESGKTVFGLSLYENSVVWFLLALFIACNIANIIVQIDKAWIRVLCAGLCYACGLFLYANAFTWFCLARGLLFVGIVCLGYRLKKINWLSKDWYGKSLAADGVIGIALFIVVILAGRQLYNPGNTVDILYAIGTNCPGLFFAVLFFAFSVYTDCFENFIAENIRKFGRYTYWAMCIHSVELDCIPWYLINEKFPSHQLAAFLITSVIRTVMIAAGCIVLDKIYKKQIKRRRMNGKKK